MNINRNDLADLVATYQTIIKESHDETGSAPVENIPSTPTQSFEQRLLQAAQNGELTEDLVQQIVADIWDAAQEAYADMSAQYESELD